MRRALQEAFVPGRTAALFKGLVDLVRREPLTPKLSFEERWQKIESLSLRERATATEKEILTLVRRVKDGRIPHKKTDVCDGLTDGTSRSRNVIRIGIDHLPEGSLPPKIRASLLTHLDARRTDPKLWGGEPSLGLSFYRETGFDGRRVVGLELMVDTINPDDGSIWATEHRQGIQAEVDLSTTFDELPFKTRVIKQDWDRPHSSYSKAFDGLEIYIGPTLPFQLIKTLARFAESVVQGKLPQSAQPQSTR